LLLKNLLRMNSLLKKQLKAKEKQLKAKEKQLKA
jgi:hypothetical protein